MFRNIVSLLKIANCFAQHGIELQTPNQSICLYLKTKRSQAFCAKNIFTGINIFYNCSFENLIIKIHKAHGLLVHENWTCGKVDKSNHAVENTRSLKYSRQLSAQRTISEDKRHFQMKNNCVQRVLQSQKRIWGRGYALPRF